MKKIINVPQGYSARIVKTTPGINGLYTENFSSCNIVACFSPEKIMLMHVDLKNAHKLSEELQWITDAPRTIIIAYRENHPASASLKNHILKNCLGPVTNDDAFKVKNLSDDTNKFCIFFDDPADNNITAVKLSPTRPENLIRHPQEQQLEAVQKIEQLIGLQTRARTLTSNSKKTNIFDGMAWQIMGPSELEVDITDTATKNEMDRFESNDTLVTITGKLRGLFKKTTTPVILTIDNGGYEDVASYLQGYLNNFDHSLLFKRNVKDLFTCDDHKAITRSDKSFNQRMIKIVEKEGDIFKEAAQEIDDYKHFGNPTEYKTDIILEYKMLVKHYEIGEAYVNLKQDYSQLKEEALGLNREASMSYFANDYKTAAALFLKVIKILTWCSKIDDPHLATAYYNYGQSLDKKQEYKDAESALSISLELREKHTNPKPNDTIIEKTHRDLARCKESLTDKLIDDPHLATGYYNYGQSLDKKQEYKDAESALSISLELREKHTNPKPNDTIIEKTHRDLARCKESLTDKLTETPSNPTQVILAEKPVLLPQYEKHKIACNTETIIKTSAAVATVTAAISAYYCYS